MLDLRIINATVVTPEGTRQADVGIEGSSIAEVAETGALGPAREEIDATGLYVMPGAVDVHFHCRAPSHPERGDFASETAAAAAGGVTTVFEMPISDPACSTPEVFRSRRALAEADAHVNVALYSGAALADAAAAREMAELGAIGYKLFTVAPAVGREREFAGLSATTDAAIYGALTAVAETGLTCVVHAESDSLIRHFEALTPAGELPARPPVVEAVALATVAALAKDAGARLHVAHVSCRSALDALRGAQAAGGDVTGETCPQYLLLDEHTVERYGALAKIGPPLRTAADREALWDAVRDGTLALVASDHAPFLAHEKIGVDPLVAPQGLPTVELLVPAMLDAAARGELTLEAAVAAVTSAPARRFGLDRKGTLAPGADADVAVFSLGAARPLRVEDLVSRAAGCAEVYADVPLRARVERTIVGGRVVFGDGAVHGDATGRFLPGPAVRPREAEPV
ncbi:MAG TPA: dihydroorotase family protein [Solirubrobacteraceae bacterium]|nr:dihydroorotase family protein [Solirubrobacteraceae bacterium]